MAVYECPPVLDPGTRPQVDIVNALVQAIIAVRLNACSDYSN